MFFCEMFVDSMWIIPKICGVKLVYFIGFWRLHPEDDLVRNPFYLAWLLHIWASKGGQGTGTYLGLVALRLCVSLKAVD